ncbi:MAG: phosphoenolpyruvate synthase [Halobacteriovoraceae bacterium]|nr:phosphoenolpyruvate synthase [Halobacteriovoraceae bacterium]|tara:strand:- start:26691 stop:29414 length:2724 start_codon:yes stop_codon:yes gene_type:complete
MILNQNSTLDSFKEKGGGKSLKLFELAQAGVNVPPFLVVSTDFLDHYLSESNLLEAVKNISIESDAQERINKLFTSTPLSEDLRSILEKELKSSGLLGQNLAVRSSGLEEDSDEHSFAGMFSSFLFQRELQDIESSLLKCWASAYSERALKYRVEANLALSDIKMGVVIQKMVNSEVSGVLFSRNPMDPLDTKNLIIDSLYGQCEGLVSGALDADHFKVNRENYEIKSKLVTKEEMLTHAENTPGLVKMPVDEEKAKAASLQDQMLINIAKLALKIEAHFNAPVDVEWAIEEGVIYIVQSRPITTLPPDAFFDPDINGSQPILWDNSNIVESFSGVTTPLTFSATKQAYAIVYRQTCRLLGVPESIISDYEEQYENMLGLVKGRVYYNLINWYKLLLLMPGSSSSKSFMETMMGVKEDLNEEHQKLFDFMNQSPKYGTFKKLEVFSKLTFYFFRIDKMVHSFSKDFNDIYQEYQGTNFNKKSLKDLKKMYQRWEKNITYNWKPPIINDFLVMIFFGTLKALTEKWLEIEQDSTSLQNDLLCGQGDLDSALPVKTLMKLAEKFDKNEAQRSFLLEHDASEVWSKLKSGAEPEIHKDIQDYLDLYGFRCNNEQKLEEKDLNDDPSFLFSNLQSYLRMKNYSVEQMSLREQEIKNKAEKLVKGQLGPIKKAIYFWVLKHTRNAVKNRENLRFLRTKAFGVSRKLFRAIGKHLHSLEVTNAKDDVFYLTINEIWDFIDGKSESLLLAETAALRRKEYSENSSLQDPPDRFLTYGAAGVSLKDLTILNSADLLKDKVRISDDPNLLLGTSCCPGTIKGKVIVAEKIEDAGQLNGEILVTKRTDPGWVPLYPSCSGLIIERGSLLSHSAVIARELGLPTVVGVSGGLMEKLKSGDMVELNATRGEVRILNDED